MIWYDMIRYEMIWYDTVCMHVCMYAWIQVGVHAFACFHVRMNHAGFYDMYIIYMWLYVRTRPPQMPHRTHKGKVAFF